jgi:hypothetical protein
MEHNYIPLWNGAKEGILLWKTPAFSSLEWSKRGCLSRKRERGRRESGFMDYDAIIFLKFKMGNPRSILNKGMKRKRFGWKILVAEN